MTAEIFNAIDDVCALAQKASNAIMRVYRSPNLKIFTKADASPVTEADFASNEILVSGLGQLFPNIPIVSEENALKNNVAAVQKDSFWLLDPLDGTKNFVKGTENFTVNIGLIANGVPVLGILCSPSKNICYYGFADQAFKLEHGKKSRIQHVSDGRISTMIMSKRADQETVDSIGRILAPDASTITLPSAQKFCFLFEGKADIFPCCNPMYDWDIAAGHAIVNAMGGRICSLQGQELKYGLDHQHFRNQQFLAVGNKAMLNEDKLQTIVDILN